MSRRQNVNLIFGVAKSISLVTRARGMETESKELS